MTPPSGRGDETVDLTVGQHSEQIAAEYRAAWQAALTGGPPPCQATFLEMVVESQRDGLRGRLAELDESFRRQITVGANAATTCDLSPGATAPGGAAVAATVEQAPPTAAGGPRDTVVFSDSVAGAADDGFEVGGAGLVAGYEILGELGRGGMGVVYKARQKGLKRLVALKMLIAGSHASRDQLARFEAEAESVARLHHPNIVQIYEVGQHDGLPYFSLEFVDGRSLDQSLGGKPQPPRQAALTVMILARAMQYAHENHIVHRDLKPANVLVTAAGIPKITDFGLAKRLEADSSQTKSGTLLGTPSYMAPEQARGESNQVGPSADIHALGAILYEMLTGRPPFVAASMMDTIMQVIRDDPRPPSQLQPKVPRDLETVCLKCLQKSPQHRYESAGALADDLDRFLAGEPIVARPVGPAERLWRWSRRNPRVAALTAAMFLLLAAGVVGSTLAAVIIARERDQKEYEREAADAARRLAEQRKLEADAANAEAQKNAEIATRQTKLAIESVRTLIREAQKEIGDQPNLQPLKLKLVEIALADLDQVAQSDENARLLGQVMAGAYMQMGDLYRQLGQSEKAFAQYAKSHDILQGLADRDPDGDVAQFNLAKSFVKLGQMSLELRRNVQAALESYQKAVAIHERLDARPLSDKLTASEVRQHYAECTIRVGVTHLQLGEPDKAGECFLATLKLRQALAAEAPNDPAIQLDLARSYNAVAEAQFRTRQWDEARRHFEQSVTVCERVQQAHPTNPRFLWELTSRLGNFGVFEMRTGNAAAARPLLARALAILADLVKAAPDNVDYERYLGLAHYRMATLARRTGDDATAERSNQACLDIRQKLAAKDPNNVRRQMELLLILPRCGQHAGAAERAARLEGGPNVDRELLVEVAQCYAQCAAAAELKAEDSRLRQEYLDRAVAAIRQALAKGFKDAVMLETEPDLDPLRSHPGFQAVLVQLKQP